jgi:hypothetical protein
VIPQVSRGFLQVHKQYPPQRKSWQISVLVTQPMVDWVLKIALTLETLMAYMNGKEPGVLSQMLAMAAISAPNLQKISSTSSSRVVGSGILNSIVFLSQFKTLELHCIEISW